MRKNSFYIVFLILGIALFAAGFLIQAEEWKAVSGILIGVGAGLAGANISNLVMKRYPEKVIELQDERNQQIKWKSKASSADIVQWLILGLAYLMILLDLPLWLILVTISVFIAKFVLEACFASRYQREM